MSNILNVIGGRNTLWFGLLTKEILAQDAMLFCQIFSLVLLNQLKLINKLMKQSWLIMAKQKKCIIVDSNF